jgi:hypothetical protein
MYQNRPLTGTNNTTFLGLELDKNLIGKIISKKFYLNLAVLVSNLEECVGIVRSRTKAMEFSLV